MLWSHWKTPNLLAMTLADEVIAQFEKMAAPDPVSWAERHGVHLWSKQREIMVAVAEQSRVAVKSAHNVGKSFSAGQLAAWWIDSHPDNEAFVVTTAPTAPQVKAILWKEIRRIHKKAELRGRTNLTEWWLNDEMVALGRKPADWDPEAFQGIHAKFVLVIIDEAAGVPEAIWEAAESLASNEHSKILAIGNPTLNSGKFARVCKPGSGWKVIQVDGLESPNFTEERLKLPPQVTASLLHPDWVDRMTLEWGGTESAPYIVRVRGEFPPTSADDVTVPYEYVERCRRYVGLNPDAILAEYEDDDLLPVELGVDVAASKKGDETVVRERRGNVAYRRWAVRTDKPEKVTQLILRCQKITGATVIKIDAIGWGWGVVGDVRSRLKPKGIRVVGFNVAKRSTKSKKFKNIRSQLWWDVGRIYSQDQRWDLSLVDDKTLAELTAPHYSYDHQMKIVVEPKDDTKERLGRSPDDADALLLAFVPVGKGRPKPRSYRGES